MTTASPHMYGEKCPRCGGQLDCVWGPATEDKRVWNQSKLTLEEKPNFFVLNANRCPRCGFAEILEKIDTNAILDNLLKASQDGNAK